MIKAGFCTSQCHTSSATPEHVFHLLFSPLDVVLPVGLLLADNGRLEVNTNTY